MTDTINYLTVGHACWDTIHTLEKWPAVNTKTMVSCIKQMPGGSAARTALALTALGNAHVSMISVLGRSNDTAVINLLEALHAENINTQGCIFSDQPGAQSSIWTTQHDGSRTIAAFHTGDSTIHTQLCQQPRAALFDNNKPQLNLSVKKQLADHVLKMLDVDTPVEDFSHLQGYDQVWFSEETWGHMNMDLSTAASLLKCVVGVTAGPKPVVWIAHGQIQQHQPPTVTVKDSTGAGDTWRAFLAHCLLKQMPLDTAVASACDSTAHKLCL